MPGMFPGFHAHPQPHDTLHITTVWRDCGVQDAGPHAAMFYIALILVAIVVLTYWHFTRKQLGGGDPGS
jgi:hypothetical protein